MKKLSPSVKLRKEVVSSSKDSRTLTVQRMCYSIDPTERIPMWKDWQGSVNTAADLNGNGWLDLVVSSAGHYHRQPDTMTIFYGGPNGYEAYG